MRAAGVVIRSSALAAALVVGSAPSAFAQAYGLRDDESITAGVEVPDLDADGRPVAPGRPRQSATCRSDIGTVGPVTWRLVPANQLTPLQQQMVGDGGRVVNKFCGGQIASSVNTVPALGGAYLIPPRLPAAPGAPDPGELARQALDQAALPAPRLAMAPRPEIPQLVNLPTFLWVPADQWRPVTAAASAGGVTSTVTATPSRVVWNMGNGDAVTCVGPGLPYNSSLSDEANPSRCRYTYRRSSAGQPGQSFTVTATVEYDTTWTVVGAAGGGSLGTVSRSSSVPVKVAELQALNLAGVRR